MPAGAETLRVHVSGALPGERVRVRVAHLSVHTAAAVREAWGELREIMAPSPERVAPICPLAGRCGACTLMSLSCAAQLAHKRDKVAVHFAEHAELKGIAVGPCLPSPRTAGYRNQAKYVYGRDHEAGKLVLGAYGRGSHRIVDLAGCRLVEPVLEEARGALLAILVAGEVAPFDEVRRTGVLRYAVMRATGRGEVLVTLVLSRPGRADAARVAAALGRACPAVVGVVLNVNPSPGNVILGPEEQLLWGRATLEDEIGDVRVRLSSRSFFQVNREVAARIYGDVVALAPASIERALDVYAGAAGFGLALASRAREVLAIEENEAATEAAAAFIAESPAAGRIRVVTGDAGRSLAAIEAADFAVLNPPRKGCVGQVLAEILRLRPQAVAYVSCDPRTLARDLAVLVRGGARVERVVPYDMMPHTPHVETLALLGFG